MTQIFKEPKDIRLHVGDLPADVRFGGSVAMDTETQGLNLARDRLCVVQVSAGDGVCHLVQFPEPDYAAPNLKRLLVDTKIVKIFHYARFDVAIMQRWLGVVCEPVYCTKIASKLIRTYTDRHGLKDVTSELLGIELSKAQQSSDWAAPKLSDSQIAYAAADVLNLHAIRDRLQEMLEREGRAELADACFRFLPTRARLDLLGWGENDIFAHA